MYNLYTVNLKIGKRSFSTPMYAKNYNNIISFVEANLQAKVIKISEVVYENKNTTAINVDDPSTYKSTMYFMVRNATDRKSSQIIMQTVKNNKSVDEVFNSMKMYLAIDKESEIKSNLVVNMSGK